MQYGPKANSKQAGVSPARDTVTGKDRRITPLWAVTAGLTLLMAAVTITTRLVGGARFDGLLMTAAALTACVAAIRLIVRAPSAVVQPPAPEPLRALFDAAGPAVASFGLDGRFTYVNPSAERLLGYHAVELVDTLRLPDILAEGERDRLVAQIQKAQGKPTVEVPEAGKRMASFLESVSALPPSRVPSLDAQLQSKDGSLLRVSLHVSALRDAEGAVTGLVAVAVDQSVAANNDLAERELQGRFRDLFENSSEMMATLSTSGQFLYANPAWTRRFRLKQDALLEINSFEEVFGQNCRGEVSALFRRALDGELVDCAPLRNHTPDGRIQDLELSLSQRQQAGNPLALRCHLRDVTEQKQRERRLALQVAANKIVAENLSPEQTAVRMLETLCLSQGWDLAVLWHVKEQDQSLEARAVWNLPGSSAEQLAQESKSLNLVRAKELPGRAWQEGCTVWAADLGSLPESSRTNAALRHQMASGWAVPVQVKKKVRSVLEFYSCFRLMEDREAMAAVDIAVEMFAALLDEAEERVRRDEAVSQQEVLLDSMGEGICGIDRSGLVTFANPAAGRLLGVDPASLVGKPVHELLHGAAPEGRRCSEDCGLRRATRRHKSASGEETIFRVNGAWFAADYMLTPITHKGRFSGAVLSFRDVSHRNALDQLKDEFISTVSHEMRTPLTSIRGALGLLSSGTLGEMNDKASNLLRIALSNSDRLVRLINDILDLERIQSGRERLNFRPLPLDKVVRQAIEGMEPVAEAAGVQLIHDSTQVEITADSDRLLQVVTNLLSNAVKFSPPNSTVAVMLRPGASGVTITVIDEGRGIPAEKLELIFGRFQQVDASDARQKGGSGLGLAICRTLVEQHAGRIWAERNPVRGSTFRVYLPYRPAPAGAAESLDESVVPEVGYGTILLGSRNRSSMRKMGAQLIEHGYHVLEATTVQQTVAMASDGVEAIVLDIGLDERNGADVLPMLRRIDQQGRVPILLVGPESGMAKSEVLRAIDGRVSEPVKHDALVRELARLLCGPGERSRVLIVEEDLSLANVVRGIFAREHIEVEIAGSLEAAVQSCLRFKPHLLVIEVGLPDGDGFDLVEGLRANERLAKLPLIVYSGRELSPTDCRDLKLGPTQFLTKASVEPKQLEALVLCMLRSARLRQEVESLEVSIEGFDETVDLSAEQFERQ